MGKIGMLGVSALAILGTMGLSAPAMADDLAGEGLLAVGALTHGRYEEAARQLKAIPPRAMEDPARLINLGNAYAGMGRIADARKAYVRAQRAPDLLLVTADGAESSSREIAQRALGRLTPTYAMR